MIIEIFGHFGTVPQGDLPTHPDLHRWELRGACFKGRFQVPPVFEAKSWPVHNKTTTTTTPDPPQFHIPERDVGHSLHRASESSQSALANLSRMGLEQMMVMSDDNQLTNSRINLPFQRQPTKTVESIVSQGTCCLVWRGCTHQHWRIPHLSSVYPSLNHRWTGWWFAPGCRGLEMIETSKVQGHGVLRIYCLPLSEDLQAPKKPERSFTLQLGLSATCIGLSL